MTNLIRIMDNRRDPSFISMSNPKSLAIQLCKKGINYVEGESILVNVIVDGMQRRVKF